MIGHVPHTIFLKNPQIVIHIVKVCSLQLHTPLLWLNLQVSSFPCLAFEETHQQQGTVAVARNAWQQIQGPWPSRKRMRCCRSFTLKCLFQKGKKMEGHAVSCAKLVVFFSSCLNCWKAMGYRGYRPKSKQWIIFCWSIFWAKIPDHPHLLPPTNQPINQINLLKVPPILRLPTLPMVRWYCLYSQVQDDIHRVECQLPSSRRSTPIVLDHYPPRYGPLHPRAWAATSGLNSPHGPHVRKLLIRSLEGLEIAPKENTHIF